MARDIEEGNGVQIAILMTLLLVAGCGSNSGFAGKQTKNGGPVRIERLGTMTTTDRVAERSCNRRQVLWCHRLAGAQHCQCTYVKQAEDRVRRMTGQTDRLRTPD